ncbi:hypothetical protein BHE74_00007245 [Ensete ventricosum]|nr:hypothetical protein BHE74_00007245 [Ensete ventricosum]
MRRRGSRAWPSHLQGGGRLRPGPQQGAATRRGNSRPRARTVVARPIARGGHPQGQQPASGCPAAGVVPAGRPPAGKSTARCQWLAHKGLLSRDEAVGATLARGHPAEGRWPQRRRLRVWRRPEGQLLAGKGSRRLHRGSDGGDAEGGKERARASF